MELSKAEAHENPICPYCERELTQILVKQVPKGFLKVTEKVIYFCPHCKKVLGVAQSAYA